jgi:pilus assembly protein Flp/PilA
MYTSIRSTLSCFARDEAGATAIEYGLLAAGISIAIIAIVFSIGTELKDTFKTVEDCLKTPATCGAAAPPPS